MSPLKFSCVFLNNNNYYLNFIIIIIIIMMFRDDCFELWLNQKLNHDIYYSRKKAFLKVELVTSFHKF
jgi:hypothetical protein